MEKDKLETAIDNRNKARTEFLNSLIALAADQGVRRYLTSTQFEDDALDYANEVGWEPWDSNYNEED